MIISLLFRALRPKGPVSLTVCRDFDGKEREIETQLQYLLRERVGLTMDNIIFAKLAPESNADTYAYLMRKDTKNQMRTYVTISLDELEEYLVKK